MSDWLVNEDGRDRLASYRTDAQNNTPGVDRDFSRKTNGNILYANFENLNDWGYLWITGTAGELSREAAVGRYGTELSYGNFREEHLGDLYFCDQAWGCSFKYTDAAQTTPLVNTWDPDAQEDWKSGNGKYYNISFSGQGFVKGFDNTQRWNFWPFYSEAMHVPLACDDLSCLVDGLEDDNQILSTQETGGEINDYEPVSYRPWDTLYHAIDSGFVSTQAIRSARANRPKSLYVSQWRELSRGDGHTRCVTAIED